MEIQSSDDVIRSLLKGDTYAGGLPNGCYLKTARGIDYSVDMLMVPLRNIDYDIQIANGLAQVTMVQEYHNPTDYSLEVDYKFPIPVGSCLYQLNAQFEDRVIKGTIKEKHQAQKEYQQALQMGKEAVLAQIDDESSDIIILAIGNIKPGISVTIKVSFIVQLELTMNMFYRFQLMSRVSPRYLLQNSRQRHEESKQTCLATKLTWNFKITINSNRKVRLYKCSSHQLTLLHQNQLEGRCEMILIMKKEQFPSKDFIFIFGTENYWQPSCNLSENDANSSAMVSFIPRYCQLESEDALKAFEKEQQNFQVDPQSAKGQYIFFIDRSGSMYGDRIVHAKRALVNFLKSLPLDSHFNVISFGTTHCYMFPVSVRYDQQNLRRAIDKVNIMEANMGNTQIKTAMESLLAQSIIKGYPRQIFLLTDGSISNTKEIIELIKKKLKYIRVHTIGIGEGASQALIKGCAKEGKGKHVFIRNNQSIVQEIDRVLKEALTPAITELTMKYDQQLVQTIIPNPKSIPYILKNDVVNFYVIFKQKLQYRTELYLSYFDPIWQTQISSRVIIDPKNASIYSMIDKFAQYKIINCLQYINGSCGSKQQQQKTVQQYLHCQQGMEIRQQIVRRSIKHQILCSLTAFICVGKNLQDQQFQQYKDSQLVKVQVKQAQHSAQPLGFNYPNVFSKGGVKKPHRFRPGSVALRQIRKYCKSTQLMIPQKAFEKVVRQISISIKKDIRFSKQCFKALQWVAQDYLSTFFQNANLCANHAKRVQIQTQDLQLARKMMRSSKRFDVIDAEQTNHVSHSENNKSQLKHLPRTRRLIRKTKKNLITEGIKKGMLKQVALSKRIQAVLSRINDSGVWEQEELLFSIYDQTLRENKIYQQLKQEISISFLATTLILNWLKTQRNSKKYLATLSKSERYIENQLFKIELLNPNSNIGSRIKNLCQSL